MEKSLSCADCSVGRNHTENFFSRLACKYFVFCVEGTKDVTRDRSSRISGLSSG